MKKVLSIAILTLLSLALSIFALTACGDGGTQTPPPESEGLEYNLSNNGTYYTVSGIGTCTDTNIVIPESYNNLPVREIGYNAFCGCSGLTSVTIPDSVTGIGSSAFEDCSSLRSITIGDSVFHIGNYAFRGCSRLEEIYFNATNMNYFYPDTFDHAGQYGDGIKLVIGKNVMQIPAHMFELTSQVPTSYATKIISVEFEEGSVCESIGNYAFSGCSSLTSITIPNSVTSIGNYAFSGCSSLTSITIPDSVTSIGNYAFSGCSSLTSVTIPDSVTGIGNNAFEDCSSLTSVTIGDSVTVIGNYAFEDCTSLTSVTIENTSGWYVSLSSSATSRTSVNVNDASQNAVYLTSTYCSYYWKRG